MTKKLWLIHTVDDVFPEVHGPFASEEERFERAKELRLASDDPPDGIYTLDIDENGVPTTDTFGGAFSLPDLEEEEA